jgi:hypothetical protein
MQRVDSCSAPRSSANRPSCFHKQALHDTPSLQATGAATSANAIIEQCSTGVHARQARAAAAMTKVKEAMSLKMKHRAQAEVSAD